MPQTKYADTLALQLQILVDGAIAAALVRGDPGIAVTARDAACVLLAAAGVTVPGRRNMAGHGCRRTTGPSLRSG